MFNRVFCLLVILLFLVVPACAEEKPAEKIGVVVSILPLADFVENIGGGRVEVTVMVPPGANPHLYEPTPSQMAALAKAKLYAKVGSGIEFELSWMDKFLAINPKMAVVDCSQGIEIKEKDPHIWMSPQNAKIMVRNICDGLVRIDPDNKAYYEKNRDAYLQELTKLDRDIRNSLSRMTNRVFMVYHPAFGYFAREYNLTMLPIEAEGKEPTAARMAWLIEQAKEYNIKVIFASPQFNPRSAEVIAEAIGGRVVFIDSLAKDYIGNMRQFLAELK